jgi:outer membrane protein TolC
VAVDAKQWWKVLSDPALDGLVDQAIAGNLDLQQATLRLQAVRIVAGSVRLALPAGNLGQRQAGGTPPPSIPTSMRASKRSGTWAVRCRRVRS